MGNLVSCTNLPTPKLRSTRAARVILPGGEVRQFRQPVKAAEVMLESPNNFLVNSSSLNMGRRFSALSADEDLELGNVYVMFPMRRLSSVVTAADVAVIVMATSTAARRIAGGRVKPEVVSTAAPAAENGRLGSDENVEYMFRLGSCKSRKPMLDTITEEPLMSR